MSMEIKDNISSGQHPVEDGSAVYYMGYYGTMSSILINDWFWSSRSVTLRLLDPCGADYSNAGWFVYVLA